MKFGIGLIPQKNLSEIIEWAKLSENVGFEYLWLSDYPNSKTYEFLKKIALETENIKIGHGVTNPYIKSPNRISAEIINLNKISCNRSILGISPGNKSIADQLNIPWEKPILTLKQSIKIIKQELTQKNQNNIPIYIEAQSKRVIKLSKVIADGILINASHPKDYEDLLTQDTMPKVDIGAYTSTSVGLDYESAKNAARVVVAFILAGSSPITLKRHNIPLTISENIKVELSQGNIGGAIHLVKDDYLDIFSVTGTPNDIIEKINILKEAGVTQFIGSAPIGKDINNSIKLFGDIISSF